MTATASRTTVLYILGWSRSGSTLLARLLNEVPDAVNVGELRYLWAYGIDDGRRCGCGALMSECEFWTEVLARAYGTRQQVRSELAGVRDLQESTARTRHLRGYVRRPLSPAHRQYSERYAQMIETIAEVSEARKVVDASKLVTDAAALAASRRQGCEFVLLTRDPRAVAYSWKRLKQRDDDEIRTQMPRYSVAYSTVQWVASNLLSEYVMARCSTVRSTRVRYEDLVGDPRSVIADVLGPGSDPPSFEVDRPVNLSTSHSVNGNPDRMSGAEIQIRSDDDWREGSRRRDLILSSLISAPVLARYGYRVRTSTRGSE